MYQMFYNSTGEIIENKASFYRLVQVLGFSQAMAWLKYRKSKKTLLLCTFIRFL